jgi:hypothetical protein
MAPGDDTAVPDDDGADGDFTGGGRFTGFPEGRLHENSIFHGPGILPRIWSSPQTDANQNGRTQDGNGAAARFGL